MDNEIASSKTSKTPEVYSAIERLSEVRQLHEQRLTQLLERLQPLCGPANVDDSPAVRPHPEMSQMALSIHSQSDELSVLSERIQYVLSSLEI